MSEHPRDRHRAVRVRRAPAGTVVDVRERARVRRRPRARRRADADGPARGPRSASSTGPGPCTSSAPPATAPLAMTDLLRAHGFDAWSVAGGTAAWARRAARSRGGPDEPPTHHRRRSRPPPSATAATSCTTARSRSWSTRSATSTGCSTCSTSTVSGSPTSSRPTSTTTTSPAGSPSPERTGAAYLVNARRRGVLRAHPRSRDGADRRGRDADAGHGAGHTRAHLHPPLLRPDRHRQRHRRARRSVGVFSGGSLLYGATGRPDLLGPDAHRRPGPPPARLGPPAGRPAARRRRGLPDPRLRVVLLRHPVRGHLLDDRAGEADQPGPHPGRGDLRRASCSPGSAPGRRTTRTWPPPTPPARRSPTSVCPGARRRRRAAPRIEAGEWVVDLRNRTAFAAGHAPGTLNFGLDGGFATYLGWLITWGTPITLLGETAEDVAEAQRELVRIGIDRPAAHATGRPRGLERPRSWPASRRPRSPTSPRCATTARWSCSTCGAPRSTPSPAIDGAVNIPLHELSGPAGRRARRRGLGALRRWLPRLGGRLDARRRRPPLVAIDDAFDNAEKVGLPPGGARAA